MSEKQLMAHQVCGCLICPLMHVHRKKLLYMYVLYEHDTAFPLTDFRTTTVGTRSAPKNPFVVAKSSG